MPIGNGADVKVTGPEQVWIVSSPKRRTWLPSGRRKLWHRACNPCAPPPDGGNHDALVDLAMDACDFGWIRLERARTDHLYGTL